MWWPINLLRNLRVSLLPIKRGCKFWWCPINRDLYTPDTTIYFMTGANPNDQICLNPDCPDYRKKNTRHIIKKGFNAKGNQMFKCKTCGMRFPETKGTVFYNRHLEEEQIIMVCKLLVPSAMLHIRKERRQSD